MTLDNPDGLERWLRRKPRAVAVVIAARAALRLVPLVGSDLGPRGGGVEAIGGRVALPVFRAAATAWVAVRFRDRADAVAAAASAALDPMAAARSGTRSSGAATAAHAAICAATAAADVADPARLHGTVARTAVMLPEPTLGDAVWLEREGPTAANAERLAALPLWRDGITDWVAHHWTGLERALLAHDADWSVWTEWYRDRLDGRPADAYLETSRVLLPGTLWSEGPRAVNPAIRRLIDEQGADPAPAGSDPAPAGAGDRVPVWDVFISHSPKDAAFARWIAQVLVAAGFRVFARPERMPPGCDLVAEIRRGLAGSGRVIALQSPGYVTSKQCQAEWAAACTADPDGAAGRLVSFLVRPAGLPPLARRIAHQGLVGLMAEDAATTVLRAIGAGRPVSPVPPGWPGGGVVDRMQAAAGGVYAVAPGPAGLLRRSPSVVAAGREHGFSPEQLFADFAREMADLVASTNTKVGNVGCSERLKERVARLHQSASVAFSCCDPLAINKQLVWVLRVLAMDQAEGVIPPNHELAHYRGDLYGYYNRLEEIFPNLKPYRAMDARNRFVPPSEAEERAIKAVYATLGNPAIASEALAEDLSVELKEAGSGIEEAKQLRPVEQPAGTPIDVTLETHADAATRSLAVWGWLSNAREKFVKTGRSADEAVKTIESYEKLYKKVSPDMTTYVGFLLKWFF